MLKDLCGGVERQEYMEASNRDSRNSKGMDISWRFDDSAAVS